MDKRLKKKCHICHKWVDPEDKEAGHCFPESCKVPENRKEVAQ